MKHALLRAFVLAGAVIPYAGPARAADSSAPSPATPDCFARGAYTHDGFYLSGGLGLGALFVSSQASISNGFRQRIPSSAVGELFPMIDVSIGGTFRRPLLVLGARYVMADAVEPSLSTLGRSFGTEYLRIGFQELALFGSYYLDPHVGTHIGGSVGYFTLYVGETRETLADSRYPGSNAPSGVSFSVEGGQDFWLMREVSAGLTLRLALARLSSDSNTTLAFAPTLVGSLLLH